MDLENETNRKMFLNSLYPRFGCGSTSRSAVGLSLGRKAMCVRAWPWTPTSTLDAEVAILTDQVIVDLFESEQEAADVFRSSSAKLILWNADDAKALDGWDSISASAFEPASKAMSDQARLMVKVLPITDRPKCARSWRRVPDVGSDPDYPDLSARDADAVRYWDQTRG